MKETTILTRIKGTQFEADMTDTINVGMDGKSIDMSIAMWNLITSAGALRLYTKGLVPNRHWRFGAVKKYFGIKGNRQKAFQEITAYKKYFLPDDPE